MFQTQKGLDEVIYKLMCTFHSIYLCMFFCVFSACTIRSLSIVVDIGMFDIRNLVLW